MKKKKRLISLLLSMVIILALLPTTALAAHTFTASVTVEEPAVGNKPATTGTAKYAVVTNVVWSGELDANGCFKAGVAYTVTVTSHIEDSRPNSQFKTDSAIISLHHTKEFTLSDDHRTITASYTFPALKTDAQIAEEKAREEAEKLARQDARDEKTHAQDLASRWSRTEADANYPLGSPITLLVNEETLKGTNIEAYKPFLTNGAIIRSVYGPDSIFYTLDGETLDNKSLPKISSSTTINHYRVTRVVYDYYRADDPSLDRFPNCTELWLSPRCDIDGILRTLGNIESYKDKKGDFISQNCTVFIPDSLYPNGPAYTDHPAPGCKVMLYSGGDVYAAVRAGKNAARDWCANHSYTYQYISEDRRCTYPTCSTDARFYYSCSKCGKCEYNPGHTFYPTVGSFDNGEDGGRNTAHSFVNKVVTDEHFLGLNTSGDRVYLYVCENCGKDRRQAADASQKKFWVADGTGAYYNHALSNTVVGKKSSYDTYAIAQNTFIPANMDAWATGEVLAASEAGLIDVSLMGSDYTAAVNRLQFSSIAVRLAETMAGKVITPAPSGTFTDTDNEYARKAAAAGIISGVGDGRFDPDGILTRQQMATFLYGALQWAKNNSDIEYTIYESKLSSYTDADQLADWAREPMAFMNALGLISGTSETTLSPNDICTIEQAIVVASRSLYADRIGWYQYAKQGSDWLHYGDRLWVYFKNSQACCMNPYGFESEGLNLEGGGYRPIKDR